MDLAIKNFSEWIRELDLLIQHGQGSKAQHQIQELTDKKTKIPRLYRVEVAMIARRLSLPYLSLKILRPIIYPRIPIHPAASNIEKAEFAAALGKIGATTEAESILDTLSAIETPDVYHHRCNILFRSWDYAKAVPLLKKYIQHQKITKYQSLVGKINLAAAYVFIGKTKDASVVLEEILALTSQQKLHLLRGNALELMAQNEIFSGNFSTALKHLTAARKGLTNSSDLSEFFIRKWTAVLNIKKNETPTQADLLKIQAIKAEAIARRHWETVRECDFYVSVATKNIEIFKKVYFGTPFVKYRERMKSQVNFPVELGNSYIWLVSGEQSYAPDQIFELKSGTDLGTNVHLESGRILSKCLNILCQDFYRPISEGALFNQLFPQENFNPDSSPARVTQVLHRLRNWFDENQIPLSVMSQQKEFKLVSPSNYAIRVGAKVLNVSARQIKIEILKKKWPYQSFSSSTASQVLQCSVSAATRLLTWARSNKKVITSGNGRSLRYRFAK